MRESISNQISEPVLRIEGASKKFCRDLRRSLWYGMNDLVSEVLPFNKKKLKLRQGEFWALQDVSFELRRGETMGFVGHNGAGKSTLLKIINGLMKLDAGRIVINGRIGALIELGTGFNPILTGRENIFINAAVLGLSRREVNNRLQEILDFAELGDFIDAPLQSYSSGMKVRLGFAIASHLNPDILLIDEVLAVGDASFRERCLRRLENYKKNGGSIILVSHNTLVMETFCDRVLWLDHGKLIELGAPYEVVQKYEKHAAQLTRQADERMGIVNLEKNDNDDLIKIRGVKILNFEKCVVEQVDFGQGFEVQIDYEMDEPVPTTPFFIVSLTRCIDGHDITLAQYSMHWDGLKLTDIPKSGAIGCVIFDPNFGPGNYGISVGVIASPTGVTGRKWYAMRRTLGSIAINPGNLKQLMPGILAAHIVSKMPLVLTPHKWEQSWDKEFEKV